MAKIKCKICQNGFLKDRICENCGTKHNLVNERRGNISKTKWVPLPKFEIEKTEPTQIQQVVINTHGEFSTVTFNNIKADRIKCPNCQKLLGIMFQLTGQYETVCPRCKHKTIFKFNL